jgi:UDP-N-acetylglucosamine 2-epimerase (non-hydrolysing)
MFWIKFERQNLEMLLIAYGTTAELIKISPIIKGLDNKLDFELYCTNQQQQDLIQFHKEFSIFPNYTFKNKNNFGLLTATDVPNWFISNFIRIFKILKNNLNVSHIIVQGDTLTAFMGALVGWVLNINVIHIEAGLRSRNVLHPFPEELIRRFISRVSEINFAPGHEAYRILKNNKGVTIDTHFNTGVERLLEIKDLKVNNGNAFECVILLHRTELLSNKRELKRTMHQILKISNSFSTLFIVDQHLKHYISKLSSLNVSEYVNLHISPKLSHVKLIQVIKTCKFVISDSGGLQEELYILGKPLLVHRKKTERNDGIGSNALLSQFRKDAVLEFSRNFKKYEREEQKVKILPSEIILDYIIGNIQNEK